MEMHLKMDSLHMEQPLGTCSTRAVVEGEMTLPGGLREENRLLHADAMAVVESAEAMQDRVNVGGRVVFHAMYVKGDPAKVASVEAAADFTHLCDMPGALPRAQVNAQAHVEQVDAAINGSRLTLRAVVRIDARALSAAPVDVVCSVGDGDVQTRSTKATIRRTVGQGRNDTLLREEFALPESLMVRETLYATAYPQLTDASGGQGSVGLGGQVLLEAVHASNLPGKPIVVTRHTIPVEQAVPLSGEGDELLEGRAVVKDVAVASQDAGDGECTLRVEVLLGLEAWADRLETTELLEDAYTLSGDDLRLTGRSVPVRTGERRYHTAESGKVTVVLPEGSLPVRNMLAAFAAPVLTEVEQVGGRMNAEGRMAVTLVYLSEDGATPVSVRQEVPVKAAFAVQGDAADQVWLSVTEVEAMPVTSDRVEVRFILHLDGEGVEAETVRVVTDAQMIAAGEPTEGIVLYFVQPGETVWEIARRYRVKEEEVRGLNPELTGEPRTGQGIVVWKRG